MYWPHLSVFTSCQSAPKKPLVKVPFSGQFSKLSRPFIKGQRSSRMHFRSKPLVKYSKYLSHKVNLSSRKKTRPTYLGFNLEIRGLSEGLLLEFLDFGPSGKVWNMKAWSPSLFKEGEIQKYAEGSWVQSLPFNLEVPSSMAIGVSQERYYIHSKASGDRVPKLTRCLSLNEHTWNESWLWDRFL